MKHHQLWMGPSALAALFVTTPRALAQVPLDELQGAQGDHLGASVAGLGDVNGDGTPDYAVGSPLADAGGDARGEVRVISGATGELLHLFQGDMDEGELGRAVAGAGDVDADGHDDLIIGQPGSWHTPSYRGRAYVFSGDDGLLLHEFEGYSDRDEFGYAVDGAGDVDADGHDDLIVGARLDDANAYDSGSVTLFSGATGEVLHFLPGQKQEDQFGFSVAGAGDLNADGFADWIVSSWATDTVEGSTAGRATLFLGPDASVLRTYEGDHGFHLLGFSSDGAGDVDGDGFDDVVIGAPYGSYFEGERPPGEAFVYSGLDGSLLHHLVGRFPWDGFGRRVAGAGDVDGDGLADVIVGAEYSRDNGLRGGSATVFTGATGEPWLWVVALDADDHLGHAVAGVGDVDGDGFGDVIVGAPEWQPGGWPLGMALVLDGGARSPLHDCIGGANSRGVEAWIANVGTTSVARNDFELVAGGVPGQPGLFYYGRDAVQEPFGDGFRCVGGTLFRLLPAEPSDGLGYLRRPIDLGAPPADTGPGAIEPGTTWRFQLWYRDPLAEGAGFNLTDALEATFHP